MEGWATGRGRSRSQGGEERVDEEEFGRAKVRVTERG